MKKHKSVVAILLSVMMIFAMMPSMVFAAGENPVKSWKADKDGNIYAIAVDSAGVEFTTGRSFDGGVDGEGYITAVPAKIKSTTEGIPDTEAPEGTAYFYDLAGSSLVYGDYDSAKKVRKSLDGSAWTQEEFTKVLNGQNMFVQLVEPSYAYSDDAKADAKYIAEKAYKPLTVGTTEETENKYTATFGTWGLVVERSEYKPGLTTDQTVTFTVKAPAPEGEINAENVGTPDLTGTVAQATVTVKAKTKKISDVDATSFHMDTVDGVGTTAGLYDGKAHTVVAEDVPGYSVSYQVLNPATGKYEAASAVTITDVQKTDIMFKAIFTDAKGVETPKGPYRLNLAPLNTERFVEIAWDQKANVNDSVDEDGDALSVLYLIDGTQYNVNDYVAFNATEVKAGPGEKADAAAARVAKNEAAKNAVAANEAQLKDFFNTYYELKDVTAKRDAANDRVKFEIAKKVLSAAETKAADEKFAQLVANFGASTTDTPAGIKVAEEARAIFQLNADKIDYEIEFTKAPEGAKVIHIKKAKKLKKDKSFSVKAVSNKGVAVSYKLINANSKIKINKTTGKITLKKGLKKGTYKFTVKAYVPGYSYEAFEAQNIVVKIKK